MLRDMSGAFCVPVENDQLRAGILGDQPVLRMESVECQDLFLCLGGAFAVLHRSYLHIHVLCHCHQSLIAVILVVIGIGKQIDYATECLRCLGDAEQKINFLLPSVQHGEQLGNVLTLDLGTGVQLLLLGAVGDLCKLCLLAADACHRFQISDETDAQRLPVIGKIIREAPQHLNGFQRQVLGFIEDQHRAVTQLLPDGIPQGISGTFHGSTDAVGDQPQQGLDAGQTGIQRDQYAVVRVLCHKVLCCLGLSDAGISGSNGKTALDLADTDNVIDLRGDAGICIAGFLIGLPGLILDTEIAFQFLA